MEWDPTQFFRDDEPPSPFALIILNQPINETALALLRKHALLTVCADGGANRFYDWMSTHNREGSELPDVIIGDLDSVRPAVRTHYENLGVRVIEDEDQYSTDFTKSLRYLRSHAGEILSSSSSSSSSSPGTPNRLEILVMGGLGGRVDQAFSQIHHLYLMSSLGLQWDVENWSTEIGGQLSTSNHIRSERVEIESDVAVLFTLELAGRLKRVQNR
ncbi:hypothetical protein AOCH_005415 [Aspergillus ochraceoroseus]|uniref:Uncharacterized protein n=1 Tax=Aspergillus ochraceoroseus TaxID=138278 RepID=A0A0F8UEQ2_9EURO|nr:hypothetical protein AOCH_005415 [Aspergillus ochraceoroseus]